LDLPVRGSQYIRKVLAGSGREGEQKENKSQHAVAAMLEALDAALETGPSVSEEEFQERQQILVLGSQDVAEQVKRGKFELNELMLAVLEAMYRGMGLHRVAFLFHDVRTKTMRARSGFGPNIENLIPDFAFKIEAKMDFFNKAMSTGKDIIIADSRQPKNAPYVPAWYKTLLGAPMLLLLPVRIKSFPAALFYGDFGEPNRPLDQRLMDELSTLRTHAANAIRQSQK
jgi:hypothetical protein